MPSRKADEKQKHCAWIVKPNYKLTMGVVRRGTLSDTTETNKYI